MGSCWRIAHDDFDDFRWCLQETAVRDLPSSECNMLTVLSDPSRDLTNIKSKFMTLQSRSLCCVRRGSLRLIQTLWFLLTKSSKFIIPANSRKRVCSISLPDPEFIRIHVVITGILNMESFSMIVVAQPLLRTGKT